MFLLNTIHGQVFDFVVFKLAADAVRCRNVPQFSEMFRNGYIPKLFSTKSPVIGFNIIAKGQMRIQLQHFKQKAFKQFLFFHDAASAYCKNALRVFTHEHVYFNIIRLFCQAILHKLTHIVLVVNFQKKHSNEILNEYICVFFLFHKELLQLCILFHLLKVK